MNCDSGLTRLVAWMILGVSMASMAQAAPERINYQGYLTDDQGIGLNGDFDLEFKIYAAPTGGEKLWGENHVPVMVTDGIFHVVLGEFTPMTSSVLDGDRWLEIRVRPDLPFPRQQLLSTPYALRAAVADVALTGAPDDDWAISGNNVHREIGNVGIGTTDPLKKLHIETSDLGIDASDLVNENIVVEATDAIAGLYSNGGGSYGSGVSLGEVSGGDITSRWDVTRKTSGAGGALEFRYFDGFSTDPRLVLFPNGNLAHYGYAYHTGYVSGDFLATRSPLGGAATPVAGVLYTDNLVYAWGTLLADGSIGADFGVSSAVKLGTGTYRVFLSTPLDGYVVQFTASSDPAGPTLPTLKQKGGDYFEVECWGWNGSGFGLRDTQFEFTVVGRP